MIGTKISRWESNITDTVNIELMNENTIASVIGDTIFSGTNAWQWQVPSNLQPDSTYKVMISSISNSFLSGLSDTTFTISTGVTGINNADNIVKSYKLSQNYPNPFNPSTVIQYSLPDESQVKIDIFNIIGQRITTLVNTVQKSGNYMVTWNASNLSSGVYFYSIRATNNSGKQFFDVKKMILMK